jgi:response regulator RpfG family c-di-GMP phosphodiesterase
MSRGTPTDASMPNLLICDDEVAISQLLQRYLSRKGYDVHTVADVDEALHALATHTYDALITDLNLGQSDGFDLLAELRDKGHTLPVLFTTGYPSQETAIKALRSGAFDYLIKPFSLEEVAERIERAVDMHRIRAENAVYARLVSLQAAGKVLSHMTHLEELVQESVRLMGKLLRGQKAWFYQGVPGQSAHLGEGGQCLPEPENLAEQTFLLGLAEQSMLSGEPWTLNSASAQGGAFLAVPVEVRSTVVGALMVWRAPGKPGFDAVDMELATQLAGMVGLNLRAIGLQRKESQGAPQEKTVTAWASLIGQLVDQHCQEYESKLQRVFALGHAMIDAMDWKHMTESDWRVLSQVYDLPKLRVPQEMLAKRGPLDDKEKLFLRQQSQWARERLADVPGMEPVAVAIEDFYEAYDGTGFPRGKRGHAIDARARLLAVVDAYVAMTSTRPYRSPMRPREAIEAIRKGSGSRYDPSIVLALQSLSN